MDNFLSKWKISKEKLPRHLAIIMDGNGRWATQRHMPRLMGHKQGIEKVREITRLCGELQIISLTLYAFSEENWKRPQDEVSGLMSFLRSYMRSDREKLIENNVVFRMIGDRQRLPHDIVLMCEELENVTKNNKGLHLNIALSYGSQNEIVRASKKIIADILENKFSAKELSAEIFESYLDTANLPPVDLLIRTSGEFRLSNFLLWQIAYAELYFEKSLWPDFDSDVLGAILHDYTKRERRFGLTSAQVGKG